MIVHLPFLRLRFFVWGIMHISLAKCQSSSRKPDGNLSPNPIYESNEGFFYWPAGSGAGAFTDGALMNVSWTANYPTVNLWLIIDLQWNYPVSIVCEYMRARTKLVVFKATDDAGS